MGYTLCSHGPVKLGHESRVVGDCANFLTRSFAEIHLTGCSAAVKMDFPPSGQKSC